MSNQILKRDKVSKKVRERSITESLLLLFPLLLTVTVLPLIVKMHEYNTELSKYDWFSKGSTYFDFFLYYKQWFFVGLCSLMVIIMIGRAITLKEKLKYHKVLLPLFLYTLLTLISTLFSDYRSTGFLGGFEQFENVFTIIGYALVVYYSYMVITSETELKLLINSVAIGALILGVIGTFQAFGMDFFNSEFGKSVIVAKGHSPSSLNIVFGEGRVYSTLYNPNYVGVYTSIMIPLFTVMLFFGKRLYEYILYGLVVITCAISMFGSQSKAGIISIGFAFLIAIIMLRKIIWKKWKIFIPIAISFIGVFIIVNFINNNIYLNTIMKVFKLTTNKIVTLNAIETFDENVQITYKENKLYVSEDSEGDIILTDENNSVIPYNVVEQREDAYLIQVNDIRFQEILIINHLTGDFCFSLYINGQYWSFSNSAVPGTYTYYNRYGNFTPIETANSSVFNGKEAFASSRGYIWSRTFPILKDYLILGSGADSFVFVFPQYDYVGFYNYGYQGTLISKPHSLFLQVGVQSGLLALFMLLSFFVLYIVHSFRIYFHNPFQSISSIIGLGVFTSIISFLVSGISNDSSISVSPVFWVIVGIGFVCNIIEKRKEKLIF